MFSPTFPSWPSIFSGLSSGLGQRAAWLGGEPGSAETGRVWQGEWLEKNVLYFLGV